MNSVFSWLDSVHHDGSPTYVHFAQANRVLLRLRADHTAPLRHVFIRTNPDGEQSLLAMERQLDHGVCQWWQAELPLAMPRTNYRFWLLTDNGGWWLNAAGMLRSTPLDASDFKLLRNYHAPHWLARSVFYQIFPDRFYDGDPGNNVTDGAYLYRGRSVVARAWGTPPNRATGSTEFYGGDLQGITAKLDYLTELGVNAIYLNPIFLAPSNHKYDVADYEQIDPHLGGDSALVALRDALDERDMRLILDIVPNHCGATHPWFTAAQADPNAPTADFFTFHRHPDQYESWLGVSSLPKLNYRSPRLRDTMYAGNAAIMRHWLRPPYRIDGWRIDVANMLARQGEVQLGHKIGREVRRALKAEAPESYLLGENFFDGTPHLQGDELDATMNYRGFSFPLLQWLIGYDLAALFGQPWADTSHLPTEALAAQWRTFAAAIPWQIAQQQLNLLGSHDTPRILTVLEERVDLVKIAVALLFCYPGVPCIYYGDEVGLTGGRDPECRACMPWQPDAWNHDLRTFYQMIIGLRRTTPALIEGGYQLLHAAGETLAFMREAPTDRLIVVACRSATEHNTLSVRQAGLADGTRLHERLTGRVTTIQNGTLAIGTSHTPTIQIWQVVTDGNGEQR
jgi:alpha-glucosidase